jgi:hypothetical protein
MLDDVYKRETEMICERIQLHINFDAHLDFDNDQFPLYDTRSGAPRRFHENQGHRDQRAYV